MHLQAIHPSLFVVFKTCLLKIIFYVRWSEKYSARVELVIH